MDIFLKLTCNQADNFGLKEIFNWIDSVIWCKLYPNYFNYYFNCKHAVKNILILQLNKVLHTVT